MVASSLATREAYVADDARYATAGHEHAETLGPYLIQLIEKPLVGLNVTQLARPLRILFQGSIRRARDDEVNRFLLNKR